MDAIDYHKAQIEKIIQEVRTPLFCKHRQHFQFKLCSVIHVLSVFYPYRNLGEVNLSLEIIFSDTDSPFTNSLLTKLKFPNLFSI